MQGRWCSGPGSSLKSLVDRVRIVEIAWSCGEQPVIVTTSVDQACRAVRNWLETLQAQGTNDNGDGDGTVTRKR